MKDVIDPKEKGGTTTVVKSPVKITLEVSAATIHEMEFPTKWEVYDVCILRDSNGAVAKGKEIERFITEVRPEFKIEWEGKSIEDGYEVRIDSIVYTYMKKLESDTSERENFFDRMTLCANPNGMVIGEVRKDILTTSEITHNYWINFRIFKDGYLVGDYSIDPRLKIK